MENKDEIRLKTVRRVDPHVTQIVDSAARTALYSYVQSTESWTKTNVEGTLMIYSREAPPYNMMIIINRLNKTDFFEPITATCDIQVKPPFLLFRNTKAEIYGIWFSADDNVHRISEAIRQKINEDTQPIPQPAPNIPNPPNAAAQQTNNSNNVITDIMGMLTRAHGVYESKKQEPTCMVTTAPTSTNDLVKPAPLRAGETSNTNVADFFAKVGMSSLSASGGTLVSPSSNSSSVPSGSTNAVLQKLFQGAAAVGGQATAGSAPIPISGALQSSPHISSSVPSTTPMSLQELEGKLKENLHVTPTKDEPSILKVNTQPSASSLLSPQVFTSSSYSEKELISVGEPSTVNNSYYNILTPGPSLGMNPKPINGSRESLQDESFIHMQANITPLTHEQLVQAFSILLKKNDFVQQLHEAYIQALNQSLKGCL
ncbi:UNVERIFIED_CONTAM: hypothetical protein RMT77_006599 [Armadillidium vulgare]